MLFSGPCSDEQRREWMESLMEQKFQVEEEDTTLKLGINSIYSVVSILAGVCKCMVLVVMAMWFYIPCFRVCPCKGCWWLWATCIRWTESENWRYCESVQSHKWLVNVVDSCEMYAHQVGQDKLYRNRVKKNCIPFTLCGKFTGIYRD